jgi:acetyl-CoA acetyltransferase
VSEGGAPDARVVGVGTSAFGSFPETDATGLAFDALTAAIEDCGIDRSEIDGLVVNRAASYQRIGEILGSNLRWSAQFEASGRMSGASIVEAAMALQCGLANCVALVYGNDGRSRRVNYGGSERAATDAFAPWGYTSPGAYHAMMFRRHAGQYGTSSLHLGEVATAFRYHASLNPLAVRREPMTLDDHARSRLVCDPLRLLDYCQINDGGVALIMTTADRARDLRQVPVRISGLGTRDQFVEASFPPDDYWFGALRECAARSFEMADLSIEDVDALMVYDNFTPTVLFTLEGLGYCEPGESGSFVEDGALRLGGRLPTNTNGGHLSESYMQGWSLNVEAVRQLRGQCGDRQVPDVNVVQYASATPRCMSLVYTR